MSFRDTLIVSILCAASVGCADDSGDPSTNPYACTPARSGAYADGTSYLGVHADPGNSDRVPCSLAARFKQGWHGLKGHGLAQPNTFSPDGETTYATTAQKEEGGCSVFALDVATGEERWCLSLPGAIASAVEVDVDGNLYVTGLTHIVSLDAAGDTRWRTDSPDGTGLVGLHFTPDGHIASVTNDGIAVLIARADGAVLSTLDIPATWGLVPAPTFEAGGFDLKSLMPPEVVADIESLNGTDGGFGVGAFAGGGAFSDNTVGIAPNGDIYIVGGGLDEDHGALVQLKVSGTADAPELSAGWRLDLNKSSASSPAISPDGAYLKVLDGNSLAGFLDPASTEANARVVDLAACEANTDADPDPEVCREAYVIPLRTGPALGASPMLSGGLHYLWEVQVTSLASHVGPDLIAYDRDQVLWELELPDGKEWTSVITVTDEHLVGTMTKVIASDTEVLGIPLPATAQSELVLVNRRDGSIAFSAPITDDATSTVTVGPDGALYVTMLSLVTSLALETRSVGGLMKFDPVVP